MRTVNALALRKRLGAVLDEVVKGKEPVAVSRANHPLVVLVPYEEYIQKFDAEARRKRLKKVSEDMDRLSESLRGRLTGPLFEDIIREDRDSH